MLTKSRMTGAWVEAGATEWPTPLPDNNQVNHHRHDNCDWCGKPKPMLFPAPEVDRFGRPTGERICVVCMGGRHNRKPKLNPADQEGWDKTPIPDAPLPQKEYIIKELCEIFCRMQSQLQFEVSKRKLGRMCVSGKRTFRVLSWEEAEGLRKEFLRRQQRRMARRGQRGTQTTEPNFGTMPKPTPKVRNIPKMQRYSKPEGEA